MVDILSSAREEESRKRDDTTAYHMQQQLDELRRQLREVTARQQWLEDLYKNTEGQVVQLQMVQERHSADVSQTLQVRQIEEGRIKQQLAELGQRVEEPLKPIRDLRAQIGELIDARRNDRDRTTNDARQFEGLQAQIRQLVSQIGMIADAQRQLRDQVQELDAVNAATRQEIQRAAEAGRLEEARLRRQGAELQEMVEGFRTQFEGTSTRSLRVDDVRRQVMEQVESMQAVLNERIAQEVRFATSLQRLEKQVLENQSLLQERAESMRTQLAAELVDVRQVGDQRMDRYTGRFQQIEERIREFDQRVGELVPQFEVLRRRDEELDVAIEALEERLLRDQLASMEAQVDAMRQRRVKKQADAAQKATLVRNVREARPHVTPPAPDTQPPPGEPRG